MSCNDNHQEFGRIINKLSNYADESNAAFTCVLLLLFFIIPTCFYFLNLILEDYLTPALNLICSKAKISDELANSTILAAAGSLPQFFSSIISLFITHTNIGIGITIGSNFFNNLCIISTVLFTTKSGLVYLKDRILLRDISFYIASLVVLIFTLKGTLKAMFTGPQDNECLIITWEDTLLLLSVWIIYVIVCSYYRRLVLFCCPSKYDDGEKDYHLPPFQNSSEFEYNNDFRNDRRSVLSSLEKFFVQRRDSFPRDNLEENLIGSLENDENVRESLLYDTPESFSCYLYKKNKFYSKFTDSHRAWDLKWVTCYKNVCSFKYCRNREKLEYKVREFHFDGKDKLIILDEYKYIFKISNSNHSYFSMEFKAQTASDFHMVCMILTQRIAEAKSRADLHIDIKYSSTKRRKPRSKSFFSPKILRMPEGSFFNQLLHLVLFPFKLILYLTTCDLRSYKSRNETNESTPNRSGSLEMFGFNENQDNNIDALDTPNNYDREEREEEEDEQELYGTSYSYCFLLLSVITSIGWLFFVCYVINVSSALFSNLIGVSTGVMGLTVVSLGTSLPGMLSAISLSSQGLGGLVITNMCYLIVY